MPLLKQSIKSLLQLLRPEDQVSVVVYSGKAKVALKPTSGDQAKEIARVIDGLKSDGETNEFGLRINWRTKTTSERATTEPCWPPTASSTSATKSMI